MVVGQLHGYFVLVTGTVYNFIIFLMQTIGPVGLFIAMIIQAVVAPIPSELVLMIAGAAFPLWIAILFGGLGEVAGAVVSFHISLKFGRPLVEKLVGKTSLRFADAWFKRYGGWAVLIGRLVPFIPFDAISYAAGLTKISFRDFIVATTIGAFPRAAFYCFLGTVVSTQVEGMEGMFSNAMLLLIAVIVLVFVAENLIKKRVVE